jgi:methionine-rich copper-binding protein CopC
LWKYDGEKRANLIKKNLMVMMRITLPKLAHFLVNQPSPLDKLHNACAPFNFYRFDSSPSPKNQVVALVKAAGEKYKDLKPLLSSTEKMIDIDDL